MKISNKKDLKSVLESQGFSFKKSLGQNFLIDDTVCPRMADAVSEKNVGVLEIGPGAGVLTAQLSAACKKVVSVELDTRLKPVLEQTLGGCDNVKIIWNDILKIDLKTVLAEEFADCAEKLTAIIRDNDVKSVTILRMDVPCCGGLQRAAETALRSSGKFIPWQVVTISRDGRILD